MPDEGDLEAEAPDWDAPTARDHVAVAAGADGRGRCGGSPWTRPLLAIAAVLVAAVGLRALWTPAPTADPGVISELPVEQILAEVEAMLADDSIPGFELIDQGMDDAIFENGAS